MPTNNQVKMTTTNQTSLPAFAQGTMMPIAPVYPLGMGTTTIRPNYLPSKKRLIVNRLSIPITVGKAHATPGRLEITLDQLGPSIELTLIIEGKQAVELAMDRESLETLVGRFTLEKLAK